MVWEGCEIRNCELGSDKLQLAESKYNNLQNSVINSLSKVFFIDEKAADFCVATQFGYGGAFKIVLY